MPKSNQTESQRFKWVHTLSLVLAVVSHPAFYTLYISFIFYYSLVSPIITLVIILLFSLLIPAALPKLIHNDFFLKDRLKRPRVLIMTAISYAICLVLLRQCVWVTELSFAIKLIYLLLTTQSLCLLFAAYISLYYKISLHGIGLGAILFMPIAVIWLEPSYFSSFNWVLYYGIGLPYVLLVSLQRVSTKAHNVGQILAGMGLVLVCQMMGIILAEQFIWR